MIIKWFNMLYGDFGKSVSEPNKSPAWGLFIHFWKYRSYIGI